MKVLISGKDSYIGTNIKKYLEKNMNLAVDEIDVQKEKWKMNKFSKYNTVVHVAGIVHKKNSVSKEVYKKVNVDLTLEVAKKSKKDGVKQFVFMSTMGVYGVEKKLPFGNVIDENTNFNPKSYYGKSKLEAELKLQKLEDEDFKIIIIRPPNVYGKNCRGNYIKGFCKLIKILPVFPKVFLESRQGMIYIDNLSELVGLLIIKKSRGIFMPQDTLINTVELIEEMSVLLGKKIIFSKHLGTLLKFFVKLKIINKIYGGISYSEKISEIKGINYELVSFKESIKKTLT